jgi:hypothetical protein
VPPGEKLVGVVEVGVAGWSGGGTSEDTSVSQSLLAPISLLEYRVVVAIRPAMLECVL